MSELSSSDLNSYWENGFLSPINVFTPGETKSFSVGVYQVLIADLTLSFDNTIAVVAASKGNFHLMVIGLLLSVFLIATLASYFAEYIKKHMWLGYLGLFVILIISIQLIIGGLVSYEVLSINEKYKFLFL